MTLLFNLFLIFIILLTSAYAQQKKYNIVFKQIKPGVWFAKGYEEEVNPKNGGFIANIGLIIGEKSCLVIDAGPTRKYGEQLINEIKKITKTPIKYLVLTHRHFDHSFGLEAFALKEIEILMHPKEFESLVIEGPPFYKILSNNIGNYWTEGTLEHISSINITKITKNTKIDLGSRLVDIISFEVAHTSGDLGVLDNKSGAFFSGDLVFVNRAATTTNANIKKWKDQLLLIKNINWNYLIPGHGSVISNPDRIADTFNCLSYLEVLVNKAILDGDSVAEILELGIPEKFNNLKFAPITLMRDLAKQIKKIESYNMNDYLDE